VLRTRILTAAIALPPLFAFVIVAPPWLFSLMVGVFAAWGLYEVGAMAPARSPVLIALLAGMGGVPALVMLAWVNGGLPLLAAVVVLAMCGLIAAVSLGRAEPTSSTLFFVIIGGLYVGVLYPYLALLRNMSGGIALLILMLAAVMAGDSGAYFIGRWLGRTKLIPAVSPGKTVEGAVAYLVCAMVAALVLNGPLGVGWSAGAMAAFAVALGVMAQLGDLAESALKRVVKVKDSGWLFPGHGGLLDRADSLVFAAVFTYYYSRWLGLAAA
jgi:phosphatidate cytidylyltransferase